MIRSFSTKNLRNQRGAMFGLDARIALAIFAGLSVIAGMAVFGTIRQTSVTALLSEFDNISKGYINYAFDTGIDIPIGVAAGQSFRGLYENTTVDTLGWNGPYITRSTDDHPTFGTYDIVRGDIDAVGTPPPGTGEIEGAWLELSDVPCEIAQDLDRSVDGEPLSPTSGNLRHPATCAAGTTESVYYLLSRTMG